MKKQIKKLFKTQSGRFIAGVLALALAAAVAAGAGCMKFLKADVTEQRLMTIDPKAAQIARAVDEEVEILYLTSESEKNVWLDELLKRYVSLNDKIVYECIDPAVQGSRLVISSDKRSMQIDSEHFYQINYDMLAYYYYGEMIEQEKFFKADEEIANALQYVTRDDMPVVYMLGGHGEGVMSTSVLDELWRNNIDVQPLALTDGVPSDAAIVVIYAPTADITSAEAEMLLSYLKAGGKLLLLTDYKPVNMPNLSLVTAYYGMQSKYGLVLDATNGYCYSTDVPNYLKPVAVQHDITNGLVSSNAKVLAPMCGVIERNEVVRDSLTVTALLTTSEEAYIKDPMAMTSVNKIEGDETGCFTIAMAAEEGESSLLWIASTQFFGDEAVKYSSDNNLYIMDGIRAHMLPQTPERVVIEEENLLSDAMNVAENQKVLVYIMLFAPAAIALIVGVVLMPKKRSDAAEE